MKFNKNYAIISVLVILIIIFSFVSIRIIISQNKIISFYQESYQLLKLNHDTLKNNFEELKIANENLNKNNILLKNKSTKVSKEMEEVKIEVDKVIEKMNDFEITVKDSIKWFKVNNNIAEFGDYNKIKLDLTNNCVAQNDKCRINLSCIQEVNYDNKIKYLYDDESVFKLDFLKDLRLIYKQHGGDCEDFSLLFKAEYQYLLDYCRINYSNKDIISYTEDINASGTNMYVVCGNFDPGGVVEDYSGHCVVALSGESIKKSSDTYHSIIESVLIEPQNGQFLTKLPDNETIKIFDNGVPPDTYHFIDFVITDSDLIIYDEYSDEIEWSGYKDFQEKINTLKEDIEK